MHIRVNYVTDVVHMRGRSRSARPLATPANGRSGPARTVQMPRCDATVSRPAIQWIQPGAVLVIDQDGDDQVSRGGETTSLVATMKGTIDGVTIIPGDLVAAALLRKRGW